MSTPMFDQIRHKAILTLGIGVLLPMLWTSASHASLQYLGVLNEDFEYRGDCSVCHSGTLGVVNTASKPLAQTLKDNGVVGAMDVAAFREKLSVVYETDTDEDGAFDADELMNEGDPNDPTVLPGGFVPPVQEVYGCLRVSQAPAGSDSLGLLSAGLLGLVLTSSLLRRRRRR